MWESVALSLGIALAAPFDPAAGGSHRAWLSDLTPLSAVQGYGQLQIDKGLEGTTLQVGNRRFAHGIGTHAPGEIVFDLNGNYDRLQAWVGVDAGVGKYRNLPEWKAGRHSSVVFKVFADGELRFNSGLMLFESAATPLDVPLTGVRTLKLVVEDGGDGNFCDWSDWCDPVLVGRGPAASRHVRAAARYVVQSKGLAVRLSRSGDIVGLAFEGGRLVRAIVGFTAPAGLKPDGPVSARRLADGGVRFRKRLAKGATLIETFRPTRAGVRWTAELTTFGKPWSAPIATTIVWPRPERCKIWAAWGNEYAWTDPLVAKPFGRMDVDYGAVFTRRNGTPLPLVTILDGDAGFSLIQSPEDPVIRMQLQVDRDGTVTMLRSAQRLGEGRTWRFHVDLIGHEADPRCALASIVSLYPKLFDPPIALADQVGGGGAYSGDESVPNPAKLRRMGFTFNWKASIDFPYMGMFLPPVSRDRPWNRFAGGGAGGYGPGDEGRYGQTTVRSLADYSRHMREAGFHVLNYFNVTEFGGNIAYPAPPPATLRTRDLWENPNDFLYGSFPEAILRTPDKPIGTWGGAVVMDCGVKPYQDFLVRQAQRHIAELPDSSGICIDRMDWLTQFNPHADDRLSWVDGPARSLCWSWRQLLDRIGPLMHRANKVVFVNALLRRIDLMKQVDGVYDEYGDYGYDLNTSAFLCMRKPLVCWTRDEAQLKPDPDRFVQRFLYMGAFMTVPLAGNDHTILPSTFADKVYSDYGPLFDALRGRKWVLSPRVVSTSVGKANIFLTEAGYVVPVVFGGSANRALVTLRAIHAAGPAEVLHPGADRWLPLKGSTAAGTVVVDVPLVRGCAVLRIREARSAPKP